MSSKKITGRWSGVIVCKERKEQKARKKRKRKRAETKRSARRACREYVREGSENLPCVRLPPATKRLLGPAKCQQDKKRLQSDKRHRFHWAYSIQAMLPSSNPPLKGKSQPNRGKNDRYYSQGINEGSRTGVGCVATAPFPPVGIEADESMPALTPSCFMTVKRLPAFEGVVASEVAAELAS